MYAQVSEEEGGGVRKKLEEKCANDILHMLLFEVC